MGIPVFIYQFETLVPEKMKPYAFQCIFNELNFKTNIRNDWKFSQNVSFG